MTFPVNPLKLVIMGNVKTETLKRLRAERGWSLREMAEEAKVSHQTIKNAEAGKGISLSSMVGIAEALGVNLQDLIGSKEKTP